MVLFFLALFVRVPMYMGKYAFALDRSKSSWPYKAAVMSQIAKTVIRFLVRIRVTTRRSLEAGRDVENFALVERAPDALFQGFLAKTSVPRL